MQVSVLSAFTEIPVVDRISCFLYFKFGRNFIGIPKEKYNAVHSGTD